MLEGHLLSERYKIQRKIGGGGMANVYLAIDTILDRDVAIKVLRLEYANDEEFITRFDREAQAATSLSHPNIVNIFDVGEEEHILYMVMEYVEGLTLKEYIQQYGPIGVEESLSIMKQVTSAIAHAHENNFVHRDIKPQNILMDSYGHVKVTDFGIAIALSATALTQTNAILGSVHYLSPEQARGGSATKKSDIYSLGIVFYELLTGKLPFFGQTPVAIALKHLQKDTPSVKRFDQTIPQSVENIVLRSTTKDTLHRYQTVGEMEEALETALHPDKINEALYQPPIVAGDETKAIPIIMDEQLQSHANDETIVHQTNSPTKNMTDEKNPKKKKKKKKGKKRRIILISLIILLIAGVAALFVMPQLLKSKEVTIPDVTNMEYDEAVAQMEELELEVEQELTFSEEVEEDLVVKTDPKAGRTAKEESIVTIFISEGKETTNFPDYVGRDFTQVKRLLEETGFKEVKAEEEHSDQPVGEILSHVEPEANSEIVRSDTTVIFKVSSGPNHVEVPDLEGMSEKEVKTKLEKLGLVMNKLEESSDDVSEGKVIHHSPAEDTELKIGSTVDVYISLGAEEKPPVSHQVTLSVPYELDGDVEQMVRIYIDDMNHDLSEVFQQERTKNDKDFTITLTIAPDQEAEYKVTRDDEVYITEMITYEEGE